MKFKYLLPLSLSLSLVHGETLTCNTIESCDNYRGTDGDLSEFTDIICSASQTCKSMIIDGKSVTATADWTLNNAELTDVDLYCETGGTTYGDGFGSCRNIKSIYGTSTVHCNDGMCIRIDLNGPDTKIECKTENSCKDIYFVYLLTDNSNSNSYIYNTGRQVVTNGCCEGDYCPKYPAYNTGYNSDSENTVITGYPEGVTVGDYVYPACIPTSVTIDRDVSERFTFTSGSPLDVVEENVTPKTLYLTTVSGQSVNCASVSAVYEDSNEVSVASISHDLSKSEGVTNYGVFQDGASGCKLKWDYAVLGSDASDLKLKVSVGGSFITENGDHEMMLIEGEDSKLKSGLPLWKINKFVNSGDTVNDQKVDIDIEISLNYPTCEYGDIENTVRLQFLNSANEPIADCASGYQDMSFNYGDEITSITPSLTQKEYDECAASVANVGETVVYTMKAQIVDRDEIPDCTHDASIPYFDGSEDTITFDVIINQEVSNDISNVNLEQMTIAVSDSDSKMVPCVGNSYASAKYQFRLNVDVPGITTVEQAQDTDPYLGDVTVGDVVATWNGNKGVMTDGDGNIFLQFIFETDECLPVDLDGDSCTFDYLGRVSTTAITVGEYSSSKINNPYIVEKTYDTCPSLEEIVDVTDTYPVSVTVEAPESGILSLKDDIPVQIQLDGLDDSSSVSVVIQKVEVSMDNGGFKRTFTVDDKLALMDRSYSPFYDDVHFCRHVQDDGVCKAFYSDGRSNNDDEFDPSSCQGLTTAPHIDRFLFDPQMWTFKEFTGTSTTMTITVTANIETCNDDSGSRRMLSRRGLSTIGQVTSSTDLNVALDSSFIDTLRFTIDSLQDDVDKFKYTTIAGFSTTGLFLMTSIYLAFCRKSHQPSNDQDHTDSQV